MKAALERIGWGPCFHMHDVFANPDRVPLFRAAARGEDVDWDVVFDGFRSTVDWPGAAFWRELVARYPEAKVLLTVRDPRRWYASVRQTILPAGSAGGAEALPPGTPPEIVLGRELIDEIIWAGEFGGRGTDEEHAIRVFTEHNAAVRREVPADRLLVYEVSDGWEPLCRFLGADVPDEPFPHLNDTAAFHQRIADRLGSS